MKNTMRDLTAKTPIFSALILALAIVFASSSAQAATFLVDPQNTQCTTAEFGPFATIQGALSAAVTPGDAIFVCPNAHDDGGFSDETAYQGPITVSVSNLTLIGVAYNFGSGNSRVIIAGAGADTPDSGTGTGQESTGIVTLDATGITFGNFTVDGSFFGASAGTGANNGVVVTDDGGGSTVFNTTVRNIFNAAAAAGDNIGNGILVEGGSTSASVSVLNNVVTNFRSNAILVGDILSGGTAGAARALVRGNYVNGASATGATAPNTNQRGIVFSNNTGGVGFTGSGGGVTGDIFNNRVASLNVQSTGCSNAALCASGIALEAINSGVTVRYNVLTRNDIGIFGTNTSNITFNNNQIFGGGTGNNIGIALSGSDNNNGSNFNFVQQNTITNTSIAVLVGTGTDTTTGTTVRQNTIQDAQFGILDLAISTTVGSGATANTFIQVSNFYSTP